ncbi:MAG: RluA family pseudouridine synthase [Verrucomicrobiae bacterium]|nr:RluA family pseudouridine synthase [Verrucomicrobiae bacterium]
MNGAVGETRLVERGESWEVIVPAEASGRLDVFLHARQPHRSRSFFQKLIAAGQVRVNDKPARASYRVRTGDRITVSVPPPAPAAVCAEATALNVLYEDEHVLVLNKPAGVVVHPGAGRSTGTLVNALLHHCRGQLSGIGGVERPGIVHRLDKGTSGCLVVAKTDAAHQALVTQFKSREVLKVYRAVCWGTIRPPVGRIETLIGRDPHHRKKMSTRVVRGRHAVTEYRVLRQHAETALVELTLHTGRTHQIRVHMAHIGHPVVGDPLYGRRAANVVARPLLHAYRLRFVHPVSGEVLEFTAPLPPEFEPYE